MNEEPDISNEIGQDDLFTRLHEYDLMKIFEEMSFKEKWKRVSEGLKQPMESGEHKWARLQMLRLLAPAMSVFVPLLAIGMMILLSKIEPKAVSVMEVTVIEPEPIEELEEIVEPEIDPPQTPEPTEVTMDISADMPSLPTETVSPPADVASVQPAEFDSVAIIRSPVVMRGMLGSRTPGARGAALGKYGGGGAGQVSVLRSLRWLAKNQAKDGSWGATKPAMTGLALLAYLAHGDTPESEEFGSVVESGMRFLTDAQQPNGRFKGADEHDYTHPIATYALAEAYGMTKNPTVKEAAIKGLKEIVKGQNPSGGFNYNLIPTTRDDTSYMAWCVQALKAGKIAGLSYDVEGLDACMKKAVLGFKKNYGEANGYGGFGYVGPSSSHGLSGAGALCMQFLGEAKSKEVRNTIPALQQNFPFDWANPKGGSPIYYWYYITQAYFQEGGAAWDGWNKQFQAPLTAAQKVIGKDASGYVDHKGQPQEIGSWTSPAKAEHTGGNGEVMDTILCTLMLEVFYRYLPTFQAIPAEEIEKEIDTKNDVEIEIVERIGLTPRA